MKNNLIKGKLGEELACSYLIQKGYTILDRNYKSKYAEIDIIAFENQTIVIVEVKTRKDDYYNYAREAVNYNKQNKIINLAKNYIDKYELYNYDIRFDIIECYRATKKIVHLKDAFEA